jgi:ribosomal protein S18 acetylase RimI-like enzyme
LDGDGIGRRREVPEYVVFLERLYRETRWAELAPSGWPDEVKGQFLADQFALQRRHYLAHYADASFDVIEHRGLPIGRLYVFRGPRDHRIVDISLLEDWRGRGIGSALLQEMLDEAGAAGKTVSIHVEVFNPAQRLYQRLGFRAVEQSGPYWRMEWTRP